MQEELETDLMHAVAFAEGERPADESPQALPQRVVPALDVIRLPTLLADRGMLRLRNYAPIALQEVCEADRNPSRWLRRLRDTITEQPPLSSAG
jgi:hypothetical protein